jgi:hypothetical protein
MMTVTAKAVRPENVEFEITAKMTLAQWQKIAMTLRSNGTAWCETTYGRLIDRSVDAISKQWSEQQEVEG